MFIETIKLPIVDMICTCAPLRVKRIIITWLKPSMSCVGTDVNVPIPVDLVFGCHAVSHDRRCLVQNAESRKDCLLRPSDKAWVNHNISPAS